eukprot:94261_1
MGTDSATKQWISQWDCYPEPHFWWMTCYIIAIVCATFNLSMFIVNIYQLISKRKSLDIYLKQKTYKLFYFVILIFYTLGPLGMVTSYTVQYKCVISGIAGIHFWLYGMLFTVGTMTFATQFLYLFYVLRIKLLFDKFSSLSFKPFITLLFIIGFLIQIIFQIISTYYYSYAFQLIGTDTPFSVDLALQAGLVALSVYIVCSIALLIIFIRKIYQLINMDPEIYDMDQQTKQQVIQYAVRYLWLVFITLMTTNLVNFFNLYRERAGHLLSLVMIKNILVVTDAANNVFCLYLQFKFADNLYYKLCKICHLKYVQWFHCHCRFNYCCEKWIKKKQKTHQIIGTKTDVGMDDNIMESKQVSAHTELTTMNVVSTIETENLITKKENEMMINLDNVKLPTVKGTEKEKTIDTSKNSIMNTTTASTTSGMDISTRLYLQ